MMTMLGRDLPGWPWAGAPRASMQAQANADVPVHFITAPPVIVPYSRGRDGGPLLIAFLFQLIRPEWEHVTALGPGLPAGGKAAHAFGLAFRQVVRLGAIHVEVVQLPRPWVLRDKFPRVDQHSLV